MRQEGIPMIDDPAEARWLLMALKAELPFRAVLDKKYTSGVAAEKDSVASLNAGGNRGYRRSWNTGRDLV